VPRPPLRQIVADALRVLTFRRPSAALGVHQGAYLAFGFAFTWLAGVGRYWDNPRAHLWQYAGLGSVIYVIVLAAILWVLILPLKPQRWSYRNVLLFVTLTSPPALLYAIPVEQFLTLETAQRVNVWFLGIVALWRVALLVWFLRVLARLRWYPVLIATLLPIALIVLALAFLNLEHVVFEIMAGNRPDSRSANDAAYRIVTLLALGSALVGPLLLILYLVEAFRCHRR